MKDARSPLVLVTGDVVRDCHLYGGVKTAATSFSEPGTRYEERYGGAALTHELLEAAAATARAAGSTWEVALGLSLPKKLPPQLRSYGVWMDRPKRKGSKERVWRVERHFGYGPTAPINSSDTLAAQAPKRSPVQIGRASCRERVCQYV